MLFKPKCQVLQMAQDQIKTHGWMEMDGSDSKCCLVFRRPASDIVWGFSRLLAKLYEPATAKYLDHTQLIWAISKNILQTGQIQSSQIQSWWWAVSPPSELSLAFRRCATKRSFWKITSWQLACGVFFHIRQLHLFLRGLLLLPPLFPKDPWYYIKCFISPLLAVIFKCVARINFMLPARLACKDVSQFFSDFKLPL